MSDALQPQKNDQPKKDGSEEGGSGSSLAEMAEEVSEVVGQDVDPQQMARIMRVTQSSFAGPLPPPDLMREYVDILDDGGNRIVTMAEKEQAHRHEMDLRELAIEETVTKGDVVRANNGQWMFYSIVLLFVIGGLVGLLLEKPLAGFASLGGAIVAALAGIFGPKLAGLTRNQKADENKVFS